MSVVRVLYEGRDEAIKLLDTDGDVLQYLIDDPMGVCPLLGKEIKMVKSLGSGTYGTVFEISVPGEGTKRYAVKKADPDRKSKTTIEGCEITEPYTVGKTRVNKGDIVCSSVFTEYLISLLVGKIARSGASANFFDTFYFTPCGTKSRPFHYTFMERIDLSMDRALKCISEFSGKGATGAPYPETMTYLAIQTIHALGVIQSAYKIVHGDLHLDNVFLEVVTPQTTFQGHKLLDAHYYQYIVNGTSIYIPGGKAYPFIVKLGDWGFACKYGGRKILNGKVMADGITREGRIWLPTFYTQAYDIVHFIGEVWDLNKSNSFLNQLYTWISKTTGLSLRTFRGKMDPRPLITKMDTYFSHVTPANILTDPGLMGEFMVRPDVDDSKIVLLGEFNS